MGDSLNNNTDVDSYGVPQQAFGCVAPPEFFEALGRVIAVHGQIEYLQDRLKHLPPSETNGGRSFGAVFRGANRGALPETLCPFTLGFGADTKDKDVILGLRYNRKVTSGTVAQYPSVM